MSTTQHPLTEAAAVEMWDASPCPEGYEFRGMLTVEQDATLYAMRAAFDAGREHERTNLEDDRPWEPLGDDEPLSVGDEVKWDYYGLTMTATVACVDKTGSLYTAAGLHIGVSSVGTWHVRRVAPELPTKCGTVIVANDGHKFIKAEVDGIAHRAREAVLGANGWWYGAWRKAEGDGLLSAMFPEHISAPTWKVDGQ